MKIKKITEIEINYINVSAWKKSIVHVASVKSYFFSCLHLHPIHIYINYFDFVKSIIFSHLIGYFFLKKTWLGALWIWPCFKEIQVYIQWIIYKSLESK